MPNQAEVNRFIAAAGNVGATVVTAAGSEEAAAYLADKTEGTILFPPSPSLERFGLSDALQAKGVELVRERLRERAATVPAGVTGANFGIAETGSVVLESTDESIRLATTLPERHFVLLDPRKIIADGFDAVPLLRRFHQQQPRNFLAYLTGPSRTADIERVLTIGVHGPRELHILLVNGLSDDPMEN